MDLSSNQRPETRHEVSQLVETVIEVLPEIRRILARERGASGAINPSGDRQKVADDKIDEILFDAVADLDGFGEFLSEEREEIEDIGSGLSIATDPLDGSSNIEPNTTVGTIIGVYDAPLPTVGRDLVASIFVVFGPLTTIGVAANDDLVEYIVQDGEIVGAEQLTIPDEGGIWSFSGQPKEWSPALRSYGERLGEQLKLRYTGAMIADARMLLSYGGLIGYPTRSTKPEGVLRLQYESNPIAYAVECAGGAGSTGSGRLLDLEPEGLHQRVPTYFGTQSLIEELENRLTAEV